MKRTLIALRALLAGVLYSGFQGLTRYMSRQGLLLCAASLPDGSVVSIGTTYGTAKTVSAITNADPGVATSTAHGLSNGDLLEVTSGWSNLNNRIVRVSGSATNSFNLEGINTTSTTLFPAGSGTGTVRAVTAFTQIAQVMGFQTSGGDQQFTNFSYLENNFEQQIPTVFSAQSIQIDIADDPTLAGYVALKAASDARAIRALKLALPNGSSILYNGYVSLNETPTVSKGAVMQVRAVFSLQGRPVRYSS